MNENEMDLAQELEARFSAEAAVECDIRIGIAVAESLVCVFHITNRTLVRVDDPAEVTFTFPDVETAYSIALGEEDPIAAFMQGRFRSDGHLLLVFLFLSLFVPGPRIVAPD